MEKLQEYLRENGLEKLTQVYAIKVNKSKDGKLAILTYDQISSPKHHILTRSCRGTVVTTDTFEIVAHPFTRFLNVGEAPAQESDFNWNNFSVFDKEDGSLGILYFWDNKWKFNTRGSYADGQLEGYSGTWADLFWSTINRDNLVQLPKAYTFCFELTSIYNKVVKTYPQSSSYLLAGFHTKTGQELRDSSVDLLADALGVKRPRQFKANSLADVKNLLELEKEPTFEGFVLRDDKGMRLKLKSATYLALHRLASNGNLASDKNLIPIILGGEIQEIVLHFKELIPRLLELSKVIWAEKAHLQTIYSIARAIKSQKEFAQFILPLSPMATLLFEARKNNKEVDEVWKTHAEDWLIKHIDELLPKPGGGAGPT